MKCGHRRDAIKMVRGKIIFTDIREPIINIGELLGMPAGDANHLRRKVYRHDVLCAFGQLSRKGACAAAHLQSMAAFSWNMLQKKLVVVIVVRPAFTIEHGKTIEVFSDNRHIPVVD